MNIVQGFISEVEDNRELIIKIANSVVYPIMIKASAFGGGKGIELHGTMTKRQKDTDFTNKKLKQVLLMIESLWENSSKNLDKSSSIFWVIKMAISYIYPKKKNAPYRKETKIVIEEALSPFFDLVTRRKVGKKLSLLPELSIMNPLALEFMVEKHEG